MSWFRNKSRVPVQESLIPIQELMDKVCEEEHYNKRCELHLKIQHHKDFDLQTFEEVWNERVKKGYYNNTEVLWIVLSSCPWELRWQVIEKSFKKDKIHRSYFEQAITTSSQIFNYLVFQEMAIDKYDKDLSILSLLEYLNLGLKSMISSGEKIADQENRIFALLKLVNATMTSGHPVKKFFDELNEEL